MVLGRRSQVTVFSRLEVGIGWCGSTMADWCCRISSRVELLYSSAFAEKVRFRASLRSWVSKLKSGQRNTHEVQGWKMIGIDNEAVYLNRLHAQPPGG